MYGLSRQGGLNAYVKKYPKLYYYIRVNIPQVAGVGKIVAEIKKQADKVPRGMSTAALISRKKIKEALKWGNNPKETTA